ncbi:hypothetical protein J3R82DRAFT_8292 [Butyriboletus roseoflavus]|nr:hypothetical protein J3R82DRAFT_8292 [Butyriboletus roseoflavus]
MPAMTTQLKRLEPWLDDGNIILAAEGNCFRVHRTILGSYSEVFKNMFAVPHSDAVKEDVFDGCPIVYLQDASEDVQMMLKVFYGRGYSKRACPYCTPAEQSHYSYVFFRDTPMPITVLAAFSRIGRKYVIRQMVEEVVHRLSLDLPHKEYASKISIEKDVNLFPRVSGSDPYNFMIMNIANEIGNLPMVAVAVYYCCIACPASFINDGYDFNGTKCTLSFLNQKYCFLGQRHVTEAHKKITRCLAEIIRKEGKCSICPSCVRKVAAALCPMHMWYRGPFIAWQREWDEAMCKPCKDVVARSYEQSRISLWEDLPGKLGLANWDNLLVDEDV